MLYVVLLEDEPTRLDMRPKHMAAHLDYLEANAKNVQAGGPLTDQQGGNAGGIWIVEAESAAEVERLLHGDPFWAAGLRKSVRILTWKQVYANGKRRI